MNLPFPFRLLLAVAMSLGLALVLLVAFYATDLAFRVWDRLLQAPFGFVLTYTGVILLLSGSVAWVIWRLLSPSPRHAEKDPAQPLGLPTEAELQARIEQAESAGIQVAMARRELETLRQRREAGKVYVALLGEVSTGKSSLIKALLPECEVAIDPRGGTTRGLVHYTWIPPAGHPLILTDMPGLNGSDGALDELSRQEAQRAHVVIYLVDGDLTRTQYVELQQVLALNKPVILALNKMDRYSPEDLAAVHKRLLERVGNARDLQVVSVSAGGQREVIRVHPDGREELVVQDIPVQIEPLLQALQQCLRRDAIELECLRDSTLIQLAAHKLEKALSDHRHKQAEALISQYTYKAVLGALAAISPGTDLIIQGYLGVGLVRALCEVYTVPVREVNITRFLELASKRVGKTLPLLLAVSGNALKAFPGMGTVAGGLLHAVGYGLIFDSLGRAVAASLDEHGDLATSRTLRLFEENLSDDLEARAQRLAQLVLAQEYERKNSH